MTVRVETLSGRAFHEALPALARLRIDVFRAWPYLYDGSLDYETTYLAKFRDTHGSAIVAAYDQDEIVGCATAAPLLGHADGFATPFKAAGYNPKRVFYFGESVLLPPYRRQGIGHQFFDHREAHARDEGVYDHIAFCSVVRPDDHPARPADYVALDAFWSRRGYQKDERLVTQFAWKDLSEAAATFKPMQFWIKAITP